MFCPECRYEYNIGVTVCPDCKATLVAELPDEKSSDAADVTEMDWVPLARLTSHQFASMIVDILEGQNVPVVLHSESGHFGITGQLEAGSYRPIGGGYLLMVPREYVPEADLAGESVLGDDWAKFRLIDFEE